MFITARKERPTMKSETVKQIPPGHTASEVGAAEVLLRLIPLTG